MEGVIKASLNQSAKQAPDHSEGRLVVKIVEAKDISVRQQAHNQLYCVVQFENNEFVTKEAQHQQSTPSVATSPVNGNAPGSLKPVPPPRNFSPDRPQSSTSLGQPTSLLSTLSNQQAQANVIVKTNASWNHEALFDVTRPDGELVVTIFDRSSAAAQKDDGFLGYIKIRPSRVHNRVQDNWFRLLPRQWKEKVSGELRVQLCFKPVTNRKLTPDDFELMKMLGKGSFGKVYQVRKKDTNRVYAMKVLSKKDILQRQEVQHTMSEQSILKHADSPFLVGLKFSFQTADKLYLVLDFMNGGELFYHLARIGRFEESRAKFYAAEIVLALEHLHKHNIIYRDLKPENILLDSCGHVALTDFGLCKENIGDKDTTKTFCGTAEYLAPEVLLGKGYGVAVDWWTLGVLLFELTSGLPPFAGLEVNTMYRKILTESFPFKPYMSPVLCSFIQAVCHKDAKMRLGSGPTGAEEVKKHPFFADVQWDKLLKKQVVPPFKPDVRSEMDSSNFDPTFTGQEPRLESPNNNNSHVQDLDFKGFTFYPETEILSVNSTGIQPNTSRG